MMKISEATLVERANYLYRQLLLLHRVFRGDGGTDWPGEDDDAHAPGLRASIRDVLDDLVEQAKVLTTVPSPLGDWREGDTPDDERWRPITEVERREMLSLLAAYESLIAWADAHAQPAVDLPQRSEPKSADFTAGRRRPPQDPADVGEYLKAERARIARFRRDMAFLERRQAAESA